LGCYGSEIRTPHLDALAMNGIRFRRFYNTARCCPTRASLVTGLASHQAGMGWMTSRSSDHPGYRGQVHDHAPTVAEMLRRAGYGTYMSGKWHVTWRDSVASGPNGSWPVERGFDEHFGTIYGAGSFWTPNGLVRNLERLDTDESTWRDGEFYYTREITAHATAFMREHRNRDATAPFFLYVAYTAPHWPMHAPAADIEAYEGMYDVGYRVTRARRFARQIELGVLPDDTMLPPPDPRAPSWSDLNEAERQRLPRMMETYAAMVTILDEGVGDIVRTLEEMGELDRTLIVFLSDNGGCAEGGWTGGLWASWDGRDYEQDPSKIGTDETFPVYGGGWANVSNTPFREYKHWVHEGGISAPCIMHWPERIPESARGGWIDTPAHVIDLTPTAMALAGATHPETWAGRPTPPIDGVSLAPLIEGGTIEARDLNWEHEGNRAVVRGSWKIVARGAEG
ncbi:MAG: arylsulfatase, partial [Phycisphaerales bacterium]|nr:arylsulfatase [Phycisphaerales bacterium]